MTEKIATYNADPRGGLPSASSFPRLVHCLGSHLAQQGLPEIGDRSDAETGTMIHRWLETRTCPPDARPEHRDIYEACIEVEGRTVARWLDSIGKHGILTWSGEKRLWMGGVFSGQYDRLYSVSMPNGDQHKLVIDYKTLPGEHAPASENMQLRALVVLVDMWFSATSISAAIVQPLKTWEPEIATYDRPALDMARTEVVALACRAMRPDQPRKAGPWCQHCRAVNVCHESTGLTKKVASLPDVVASWATLPATRKVELWRMAKAAKKIAARVEESVKADLLDGFDLPGLGLSEGRTTRKVADIAALWERVADTVTQEQFMDACSISLPTLAGAVAQKTGDSVAASRRWLEEVAEDLIEEAQASPSVREVSHE